MNDVIYDADGACQGRYECVRGPRRANVGSRECVVMGLKSRAVSALVTKHFVTVFSKTCNKYNIRTFRLIQTKMLN